MYTVPNFSGGVGVGDNWSGPSPFVLVIFFVCHCARGSFFLLNLLIKKMTPVLGIVL